METDRLDIVIEAEATKAVAQLDLIIKKLGQMSSMLPNTNSSGFINMASGLKQLGKSVETLSSVKATDFNRIAKGIEKLGQINNASIYRSGNSVRNFANSLEGIGTVSDNAVKIGEIASGISRLGSASMQRTIAALPKLSAALKDFFTTLSTAPNVSSNIINMTNAMASLASNGAKFSSTINGLGRASRTLTQSNNETSGSFNSVGRSSGTASNSIYAFTRRINSLVGAYFSLKYILGGIEGSVKRSMDFVETINLFQTSYKKIGMEAAQDLGMSWGSASADSYAKAFIDRAQAFNDRLTSSLGLDPNIMMNYQAVFGQISNSLGLTSRTVENVSESFTMLGNDIASLWNIDTKSAMEKLQSGLVGQTRPLRELGIDITEARLQLTAYQYGITESVKKMSQAEKVQLRWLTIMNQSSVAFADMSRTINSPANQLRILRQQWENLSRSIGNVFLPIVTTVLPYINAVVIALRNMIDTLATAMGYELPDYKDSNIYTDVTGDIIDAADATDAATKANEKYKKSVMSIDELNILTKPSSSKSGSGSSSGGSGNSKLDDAINKKTASYFDKWNEELAKMQNKSKELAELIQPKLEKFVEFLGKISPALEGIALGFATYEIITLFSNLAAKIGLLSMTPAGVIAIAIGALGMLIAACKKYYDDLVKKDLAEHFGNVILSQKDIDELVKKFTDTKTTAKIDVYLKAKADLNAMQADIEADLAKINKYNWKVSVGLGLTAEEQKDYRATIEKFITDSETYITQQQYVVDLAIKAVVQDDGKFSSEMQTLVDSYFNGSKGKMEALGKELRGTMDKALADGVIDATEQKTINNLIAEINEIASQVSDAQFKAKLQMITVEGGLSADSFKDLTKQIQSAIDEKINSEKEAYQTSLIGINVAFKAQLDDAKTEEEKNKIQKKWDASVQEMAKKFSQTKANISFEGINFVTGTLTKNWGTELSRIEYQLQGSVQGTLQNAIDRGLIGINSEQDMRNLVDGFYTNYTTAWANSGMDTASRSALTSMLKYLKPNTDDNKSIYDAALKTGGQVPKAIVDELTSEMNLSALTGASDGIYFTIGQRMATSPEILTMIANGKLSAANLDDGIILGLKSKIPDLKKQGTELVFSVDAAIKSASKDSKENNMPGYSAGIIKGYNSSFDKDTSTVESINNWLKKNSEAIKNWKMPQITIPMPKMEDFTIAYSVVTKGTGKYIPKTTPAYAVGGFPEDGLFYANHSELVGQFSNGKTAVANNAQITEGIRQASYQGVSQALMQYGGMSGTSRGDINVRVPIYISKQQLAEAALDGIDKLGRKYQTDVIMQ